MRNNTYPILKIPKAISDIAVQAKEISSRTQIRKPVLPSKPNFPESNNFGIYHFLTIIAIAVATCYLWFFLVGQLNILIAGLVIAATGYFCYQRKLDSAKGKAKCDSLNLDYRREVEIYNQQLREWQNSQTVSVKPGLSLHEIQEKFQHISVLRPGKSRSSARKGRSEEQFYQILCHYFSAAKIMVDYNISKYRDYPYTPDFIYCLNDWNFYMDIEIDEPYTRKGKKTIATHCTDDVSDANRDDFFVESNWVVIRFAEEQICKSPASCCKFIALVINRLLGVDIPPPLQDAEDLLMVNRWNTKLAKKMARNKYRSKY